MVINSERGPKADKDASAVRRLLPFLDPTALDRVMVGLTRKERRKVDAFTASKGISLTTAPELAKASDARRQLLRLAQAGYLTDEEAEALPAMSETELAATMERVGTRMASSTWDPGLGHDAGHGQPGLAQRASDAHSASGLHEKAQGHTSPQRRHGLEGH